jgi:hypothetical protein
MPACIRVHHEKVILEDCHLMPCGLCLGHVILFRPFTHAICPFVPSFSFSVGPLKVVVICIEVQNMSCSSQTILAVVYCNKITSYICSHSSGVILFFPFHSCKWANVVEKEKQ